MHLQYESFATHHLLENSLEDGETAAGFEGRQVVKPVRIRFHDLRHTACTRMLEGGVSFHVVASIMGWSATSMIRMSKRYGHIGQGAHRQAVELLGRSLSQVDSFEKSPEISMGMSERIQ